MSEKNIVSYSAEEVRKMRRQGLGKTDWKRLAEMRDDDIDCSDIPEISDEWLKKAVLVIPDTKERVTMRYDRDILDYFRRQGRGYQTRMNAVLRAYVDAHQPKPQS